MGVRMESREGLLPASDVKQDQPELILQSPQSIKIFLASSKPAENRVQKGFFEMKMLKSYLHHTCGHSP